MLIPFLRAGLDVDGCEVSADMLQYCRSKAVAEGLSLNLYQQPLHARSSAEVSDHRRLRHVWILRLAFVAAYSVFFMLPVVLSQDVAPSMVKDVTKSVMGNWSVSLTLLCYWLVMALFMAFSTVYDARLYIALSRSHPIASSNVIARPVVHAQLDTLSPTV